MRTILVALLLLPFFSQAQINRSANELAKEYVDDYLNSKIFKGRDYKPVSYGELQAFPRKGEVVWTIDRKVLVTERLKTSDTGTQLVTKLYDFRFYLDSKLKVLEAQASTYIQEQ